MASHLDRQIAQLALHQRRIRQAEISIRKGRQTVEKAKSELPKHEKQIRKALVQADKTIAKINEIARKEFAQKGEVDKHVSKQATQIKDAARNLAKQVEETRQNLSKWRMASLAAKQNALHAFHHNVDHYKRGVFYALLASERRGNDLVINAIMRSSKLMSKSLMGKLKPGDKKYRAPAYITFSSVGKHPGTEDIDKADKNIAKIKEAKQKFRKQVAEHKGKLVKASEQLNQRRDDAYRKIKEALKQRSQQGAQWTARKAKLKKALSDLAKRKRKIAAAERDVAKRQRMIRGKKARLGRAARYLRGARRGAGGRPWVSGS